MYLNDGIERKAASRRLLDASATSSGRPYRRNNRKLRGKLRNGDRYQYRNINLKSKPVDYGGNHPYEVKRRRRRQKESHKYRRQTMETNYKNFWYDPSFNLDEYIQEQDHWDETDSSQAGDAKGAAEDDRGGFKPIRIRLDTDYLMYNEDFLMEGEEVDKIMKKKHFIEYHVLPPAIQFWAKTLSVYPAKKIYINNCGDFASPYYSVHGRDDADLVLFLTANISCSGEEAEGFQTKAGELKEINHVYSLVPLLFVSQSKLTNKIFNCCDCTPGAIACERDQYDRPIGGVIDFCFGTFKLNEHGQASEKVAKEMVEIAIHEIGHILGLSSDDMVYYHDQTTGLPRTPRPLKPSKNIVCVNGKNSTEMGYDVYAPSSNTLKFGAHYPGIRYYEVVTPTVRQVARNHFNCKHMNGMRLENQVTSDGKVFVLCIILCIRNGHNMY